MDIEAGFPYPNTTIMLLLSSDGSHLLKLSVMGFSFHFEAAIAVAFSNSAS